MRQSPPPPPQLLSTPGTSFEKRKKKKNEIFLPRFFLLFRLVFRNRGAWIDDRSWTLHYRLRFNFQPDVTIIRIFFNIGRIKGSDRSRSDDRYETDLLQSCYDSEESFHF